MAVMRVRRRRLPHVALALYMCLSLSLPPLLPRLLLASRGVWFWHVEGRAEVDKGWTCASDLSRGTLALTAAGVRRASRVSVGLTPCQPLYGGFLSCLTCVGSRGRFRWISL